MPYDFFQNRDCEYFPCHPGADPETFSCIFCYCPLYALGDKCGGNFSYTENGIKDCTHCLRPHRRECYGEICSTIADGCSKRIFTIDGNDFSDLEGFFCIIDSLLTKNLPYQTGHNLNAFNDLLCGGFGAHEYGEPITLRWRNYKKSKRDLGPDLFHDIVEIILNCNNSDHNCKLELY